MTLLEVAVALVLCAALLAMVLSIFTFAAKRAAIARTRNALERDAVLVVDLLQREARRAGSGAPKGGLVSDATQRLDAVVFLANSDALGFVADLPRPDAQYAALSLLSLNTINNGAGLLDETRSLFWMNENNGNCQPSGSGSSSGCSTSTSSTFFPGLAGCTTSGLDRTCPWSLGRMRAGEAFQVLLGDGTWLKARHQVPIAFDGTSPLVVVRTAAPLAADWSMASSGALPLRAGGEAFVATLDRVWFVLDAASSKLERIQCFDEQPAATTTYGNGATTTLPDFAAASCTRTATHREFIARNVKSATFTYRDVAGASIGTPPLATAAEKRRIARIDYRIVLEDRVLGETVTHEATGVITLRNPL
jgi:hypothetical protein